MLLKLISQPRKKREAPLAFRAHLKLPEDVNGEYPLIKKGKGKKTVRFSDSLDIKKFVVDGVDEGEKDQDYEGEKDQDYESKKEVPTLKRSGRSFPNSLCNLMG